MNDTYKSIAIDHIEDDGTLVKLALDQGVDVHTIRYDIIKGVYRGALQDKEGTLYYFNCFNNNFRLVKADTEDKLWEGNRILKTCTFGCDLIKSEAEPSDKNPEEHEEELDEELPGTDASLESEDKAGPQAAIPTAASPTVTEEQNIANQDNLLTDVHPGALGGDTPDDPNSGQQWHAEKAIPADPNKWGYTELLKSVGKSLYEAAAPTPFRTPSYKEQEFMVTYLGKTPEEAASGAIQFNPTQRALFNRWLNKSLYASVDKLKGWLDKNG